MLVSTVVIGMLTLVLILVALGHENRSAVFFYSHIPKSGGTSFGMDLRGEVLKPCVHPMNTNMDSMVNQIRKEPERAINGCNYFASESRVRYVERNLPEWIPLFNGIGKVWDGRIEYIYLLRDPQELLISMWSHCQHGRGYQLHHYDKMDLADWVQMWRTQCEPTAGFFAKAHKYCGYNPRNPQTVHLSKMDKNSRFVESSGESSGELLQIALERLRNGVSVGREHIGDGSQRREAIRMRAPHVNGTHLRRAHQDPGGHLRHQRQHQETNPQHHTSGQGAVYAGIQAVFGAILGRHRHIQARFLLKCPIGTGGAVGPEARTRAKR